NLSRRGDRIGEIREIERSDRRRGAAGETGVRSVVMGYLTNQDLQDFGPELLDVAQRAAQHAVGPELQQLHDENQRLRDEVSRAAKNTIDQYLDANVPGWRQINADERFHQWLLMPDPYSGVIRDRLLKDAAHAANAQRVASFFTGFV